MRTAALPPPAACWPGRRRSSRCGRSARAAAKARPRRRAGRGRSRDERRRQPLVPGRRAPARPLACDGRRSEAPSRSRSGRPRPTGCRGGSTDRTLRVRGRGGDPAAARRRLPGAGAGLAAGPGRVAVPGRGGRPEARFGAADRGVARAARPGAEQLEQAIERMRFALGVDVDLTDFHRRFRRDPLVGPLIRRHARLPPAGAAVALGGARRRRRRAADRGRAGGADRAPHRRPLGASARRGAEALRDVPGPTAIAGRAPAELEQMELVGRRAVALRRSPATSPPAVAGSRSRTGTSDCWRRRRSAPGRSSAWASSAATSSTPCRPATSATSSWSAASPASAGGRRSRRSKSSTRRTSLTAASSGPHSGGASPARATGPAAALRCLRPASCAARRGVDKPGNAPYPGQELARDTRSTNSSIRSPRAARTTAAWSSGCR